MYSRSNVQPRYTYCKVAGQAAMWQCGNVAGKQPEARGQRPEDCRRGGRFLLICGALASPLSSRLDHTCIDRSSQLSAARRCPHPTWMTDDQTRIPPRDSIGAPTESGKRYLASRLSHEGDHPRMSLDFAGSACPCGMTSPQDPRMSDREVRQGRAARLRLQLTGVVTVGAVTLRDLGM